MKIRKPARDSWEGGVGHLEPIMTTTRKFSPLPIYCFYAVFFSLSFLVLHCHLQPRNWTNAPLRVAEDADVWPEEAPHSRGSSGSSLLRGIRTQPPRLVPFRLIHSLFRSPLGHFRLVDEFEPRHIGQFRQQLGHFRQEHLENDRISEDATARRKKTGISMYTRMRNLNVHIHTCSTL